jgi:hypothetical protein
MDNVFHENVKDDFIEYFLWDMLRNVELLDDALIALSKYTTEESMDALSKRIDSLIENINEETIMLDDLYDFRMITNTERDIINEIVKIRSSDRIKTYERVLTERMRE